MAITRVGELAQFQSMLRRAAYLRQLTGDGRDAEIIENELLHNLPAPAMRPAIDRLAEMIDHAEAALEAPRAPAAKAD